MKILKNNKRIFQFLFWLWLCSILILMTIPTSGIKFNDISGIDKLEHFGVFGLLGFLFIVGQPLSDDFNRIKLKNWKLYILIIFSIFIEFVQLALPYRYFEVLDILMNGSGLVSGIVVGRLFLLRFIK